MPAKNTSKTETLDRRQRRTRKLIKQALGELIHESSYDDISVTDISERADITRNTFYNHFVTKDALLLSIIEDAIEAMFQGIDIAQMNQWAQAQTPTHIKKKPHTSLFSQDAKGAILLKLGIERFAPTILSRYAERQLEILRQFEPLQNYEDSSLVTLNLFLSGGILALVGQYLHSEQQQSSELMDQIVGHLAMTLINHHELKDKLNHTLQTHK